MLYGPKERKIDIVVIVIESDAKKKKGITANGTGYG